MIYLKNNTEVQSIYIPRQTVLGGGYIATTKTYEDGLAEGIEKGKEMQKDQLLNLYVSANGQYEREDGWGVVTVDVPTEGDCSDAYNEGYDKGKIDGYDSGYQDGYDAGQVKYNTIADIYGSPSDSTVTFKGLVALSFKYGSGNYILFTDHTGSILTKSHQEPLMVGDECLVTALLRRNNTSYISVLFNASVEVLSSNNYVVMPAEAVELTNVNDLYIPNDNGYAEMKYLYADGTVVRAPSSNYMRIETRQGNISLRGDFSDWAVKLNVGSNIRVYMFTENSTNSFFVTDIVELGTEGGGCNLEDKWVTPSMGESDENGYIVVNPSEGYDGLSRTVIDPKTIYNEGIEEGRNQGGSCPELTTIDITENGSYEGSFSLVNVNVPQGGSSCNLEDKIVSPTVEEIDNGWLYVNPSEGYNGMSRVVVGTSSLRDSWYNEGVEAGRAEGGEGGSCNLGVLDWTLTSPYSEQKNASDNGYDGYSAVIIRPDNMIAQEKENAINDFKSRMQEITITENGSYSIYEKETVNSITFDGNSYFDTGIVPTENIKIEVCIKVTNGNDSGAGGIIIGGGIGPVDLENSNSTENRGIAIGMGGGAIYGVWGAIKSSNNPYKYEGEGTTTVVLQKTDDSWWWEGEKGSFGASTLYIGGYNKNGEEVEGKFTQSIVYIKIWTNKDDDSTLITYTPKTNGNFDANGVELQRFGNGTTTFVGENLDKYPNGFKSIEVNVIPSAIEGMKFGNSTFEECPFNLERIEDFSYLFENCKNLRTSPSIQKPIRNARSMFSGCSSLTTAPIYNTSEATDLGDMYAGCHNLTSVGAVDCSSLPDSTIGWNREAYIFDTKQYPALSDFGGFIGLKQTVDLSGLIALSNNSVESIFNNLYDFSRNGETPNSIQGKITMSSSVSDAVEQHRSIAESKSWTITIK